MQELDDTALLREYVERDSEEAFAALVTRHVNKVYSVALRHTGNPHSAEEITQAVFVILAKKSRQLGKRVILSGWLYQTARLTAVTFIRGGIRRARREQEACMQTVLNENESDAWMQIAPLLDAAMAGLNETDRHAVVLRFFDGKSIREVAAALGANEDAAKKRVSRALEKLRNFFAKHGVSSTTAIIAGAISANSVQAAPVALAKSVTAVALAKGAAASGSTLTPIKGALKIMAWTKAKTAIVAGVAVILATGTTTTILIEHGKRMSNHRPTASKLPTITQGETLDLQADGTIRFQMDLDVFNTGNEPLKIYRFNNSDFVHLDRITDAAGQPIVFTTQHSGKMFHYSATLNQPVPPGGKASSSMEGTMTGLIRPTGGPGVYEYSMDHWPGYDGDTRRIETHLLPAGAILLEKHPADLAETTNDGRIELRIDKIIPPGGSLVISYRFRLPANGN
ncbi:MAG: sigma-70 family RNA polymerase sigma factor [Verrucomicrobiia bacterium]